MRCLHVNQFENSNFEPMWQIISGFIIGRTQSLCWCTVCNQVHPGGWKYETVNWICNVTVFCVDPTEMMPLELSSALVIKTRHCVWHINIWVILESFAWWFVRCFYQAGFQTTTIFNNYTTVIPCALCHSHCLIEP